MNEAEVLAATYFDTCVIKVKKGDRITITQGTGQKHVLFSKKPFYYPSHIEVVLSGSSIDE